MKSAVLLLFSALALFAQDAAGVIEGSVVNSVTGAGIEGATVRISSKNNGHYQAVTDATGSFHIPGIKPGDYNPAATKAGLFSPLTAFFGGRNSVHVEAGKDTPPFHLQLIPPARLRGRVIGIDGKPAAGVEVATGNQYALTAKTDADGYFVLDNLQPGSYDLMARVNHVRTYFPATLDPTLGEPITVVGGADLGGFEIRLQSATTHRVRGVVLDSAGKPVPRVVVGITSGSMPFGTGGFSMTSMSSSRGTTEFSIGSRPAGVTPDNEDPVVTGKDGVFEFPAVIEGDWIFHVESEDLHHGAAAIEVRRDIDDLKIRIEAPFDLDGSVTLSDGSPVPGKVAVIARLVSLEGMAPVSDGSLQENGTLHLKNVAPGRYLLQAIAPPENYYVASVMAGTNDVTGRPVSLSAASPPIRVILKPGVTITGTVEKGQGATVLIVPQTLATGDAARLAACDASGKFEVAGLAPGDYYAVALNQVDLRSLLSLSDIARIRVILRDATSVRIDEGGVASVQLKAPIPLP
jgi:Carboxypeptidase regulatory-like domain